MRLLSVMLLALVFLPVVSLNGQTFEEDFVRAINKVRNQGCRCNGERQPSVGRVNYNKTLSYSAYTHALDIREQRRLSHFSSQGDDIGERADQCGYRWEVIGENLAYGQESIDEVLQDWIQSYTHCTLLMDKRFKDVGFAKVGPWWVLHFGLAKKDVAKSR